MQLESLTTWRESSFLNNRKSKVKGPVVRIIVTYKKIGIQQDVYRLGAQSQPHTRWYDTRSSTSDVHYPGEFLAGVLMENEAVKSAGLLLLDIQFSNSCSSSPEHFFPISASYGGPLPFEMFKEGSPGEVVTRSEDKSRKLDKCNAMQWLFEKLKWCDFPDNAKWPPGKLHIMQANSWQLNAVFFGQSTCT